MMVQWRTETCRPNSNKVYEDIYFVVLDGLINQYTITFTQRYGKRKKYYKKKVQNHLKQTSYVEYCC